MKRRRTNNSEENELNVTPFLGIFVTLVSFLLLSSGLVELGVLEVFMPQKSEASSVQQKGATDEIALAFELQSSGLYVSGYDRDLKKDIPEIQMMFSLDKVDLLHGYLKNLKQKYPKVHVSLFRTQPEVNYQKVIEVLDLIQRAQLEAKVVLAVGGGR